MDGLVVASPANPTGTMLDPAELAALATWCADNGVRLDQRRDLPRHRLRRAPRAVVRLGDRRATAIVVNSFSKYFSMTGWRMGWLLVPPRPAARGRLPRGQLRRLPARAAAGRGAGRVRRESYAEADGHVARYQVNRDLLLDGLARLGITRLAPADGAFYVYADVAHLTDDSMDLVYRLLADVGLAVAPGLDFDPVEGHRFIRFSCAGSAAEVREALARLERWLGFLRCPACSPKRMTSHASRLGTAGSTGRSPRWRWSS